MRQLFFLAFIVFFVAQNIEAQTDTLSKSPSESIYLPKEKSLLWEISGKDLNTPSYLYGTIHMIDKEDYFLTEATKEAIAKSGMVTFEINMEEMNNIFAQFSLLSKSFMADNLSLSDLLNEADYQLVKTHFEEKIGIPLFLFERIKPMFLTVLADMDMSSMQDGLGSGNIVSYEMEIMKIAQADAKEVAGLETAAFQMSVFDSIPYQIQANMLVDAIKTVEEPDSSNQFKEMVNMYKDQDIQSMVTMIETDEGMADYDDILLVMRNKNWIPVMGEMMLKQPTFFAVGAGHLAGEEGVIALLRKEGYEVKAVY